MNSDNPESLQDILNALFLMQAAGAPTPGESLNTRVDLTGIGIGTFAALLNRTRLRAQLAQDDEDYDDEDDDESPSYGYYHNRSVPSSIMPKWLQAAKEPQEEGVRLLNSGEFGRIPGPRQIGHSNYANVTKSILRMSNRPIPRIQKQDFHQSLVPNTNGTTVASYDANVYTAQFSNDSSFYYTCSQDFKMHIFDMTKPPLPFNLARSQMRRGHGIPSNMKTSMPLLKEIQGQEGRWTVTDANLSPDNTRIIYSSLTPTVYMTNTSPEGSTEQIPIPFSDHRNSSYDFMSGFGIYSCRFSADGNEVIAGGNRKIFVYDLLADRRTVKISAHDDDVNSCTWADTESGNVLVSASDDTFLKVWDRRSLGASKKPSGVLIGHTEGITYVSAKGDGRYVISNGKDQSVRLWDLRKMRSNQEFEDVRHEHYGIARFDYRTSFYPRPRHEKHPSDCSVMTYRGHSVLRTLIRCHFSPAETTGAQYIYSGSADGRIHIWSLDGRVVQVLDRSKTLPSSFSPSEPEPEELRRTGAIRTCVRDVSWHSQEPVLMSAAWEDRYSGTVIARHEWKGLSKMRGRLQDWVEKKEQESRETSASHGLRRSSRLENLARQRSRTQSIPGSYDLGEDDEQDSDSEYEDVDEDDD